MCLTWLGRAAVWASVTVAASLGQAQAAQVDLALTAAAANSYSSVQTVGPTRYDRWFVGLGGLDADSVVSVSQGDSITATLVFDQTITVPASGSFTALALYFQGTGFSNDTVGTHGTFELFDRGTPVQSLFAGSGTVRQLAVGVGIGPPGNAAMTFDSMVASFTINALSQPVNLNSAQFSYLLLSPAVPEPSAWALMLLGTAALCGLARQRRLRAA